MLPEYIINNHLKRGLIVTDPMMVELGYLKKITDELEKTNTEYYIYDKVEVEPSFEISEEIGKYALEVKPDFIIALGGGSVIDAAKAGWVKYENPEFDIRGISPFEWLGLGRKAILIAIPTTSGTGSEATLGVVLSEKINGKRKIALGSYELVSTVTILDPSFPLKMPRKLSLSTGLDVLAHSIEALAANTATPFTDALVYEATKLVIQFLPIVLEEPDNREARENMHLAAWIAGTAFSNSGCGLAHAIGHAIGPKLSLPHGLSVGVSLPYVVKFNSQDENARDKYEYVLAHLKLDELVDGDTLYNALLDFYGKIGAPRSLSEIVDKDLCYKHRDDIVEEAMMDPDLVFNPVAVTDLEIREVLDDIIEGI
jgi:alcohol dehydrogenase class IV